ncbi:NAD(P)-dependent oxidoreductase [Magnetovibrio sp. PR-2]|uniref:NAD(P)-dependent oxidoreductase n=1 Tax=Magnetovibrio sp. PR-2 TaxID=3120356 RepID=UPI002FCE3B00
MEQHNTIGLIGCGLMGHGLAKNLLKAGQNLTIFDHPANQSCDDLVEAGAVLSAEMADVVSDKDAVILVLPGSPEVETVVTADGGFLSLISPNTLVIDATTAQPEDTLVIAGLIQGKGARYVDAPMTRPPKEAEEGCLNVLVGGSKEDVAHAKPYIDTYAENIYHGGPVSAGHRLKLLHNFVSIGQAVIIAEAVAAANRGGVQLDVLTDVLATGGAGGVALDRMRPFIEDSDSSAFRFALKNASKDLDYYTDMASALNAQSNTAKAVSYVLKKALEHQPDAVMPELIDIFKD